MIIISSGKEETSCADHARQMSSGLGAVAGSCGPKEQGRHCLRCNPPYSPSHVVPWRWVRLAECRSTWGGPDAANIRGDVSRLANVQIPILPERGRMFGRAWCSVRVPSSRDRAGTGTPRWWWPSLWRGSGRCRPRRRGRPETSRAPASTNSPSAPRDVRLAGELGTLKLWQTCK